MIFSILSSLIFVDQKRRLIEVFPNHVRKEWNRWELRVLVLASLALQVSLIYSGNRRKHITKRWISFLIWAAYLLADWVATVALGVLVDRQGNFVGSGNISKEYGDVTLMAFWAPFLLLHLGGPDTITAYALADNELWLRHFVGLAVQTIAAIYITLLAWEGTLLSFLSIPMLLCGFIKYGERTWVLMSANRGQFRDSVLTHKDSGPSYASFMEEFCMKEAEGYYVTTAAQGENERSPEYDLESTTSPLANFDPDERKSLHIADYFFQTLKFKWLFVDLILGFDSREKSKGFFEKQDYETAFKVIEVELGFAYDVFYTKAPTIYTLFGFLFRLLTFCTTLTVLVTFSASIGVNSHKHQHVDVGITYVLLIGAVLLEVYAGGSLLFSDRAYIWFSRNSSKIPIIGNCLVSLLRPAQESVRWSESLYQYSLLDVCFKQKSSTFYKITRSVLIFNRLKNLWEKAWRFLKLNDGTVSPQLKEFIFTHFMEKSMYSGLDLKALITCRGALALKKHKCDSMVKWTVDEVEFDHSILIWHIATDLCYNLSSPGDKKQEWFNHMEISKTLAQYMLYISAVSPFMLPIEIGIIRLRDTCAEAYAFFKERDTTNKHEAYDWLGQVQTDVFPSTVNGYRSYSVLFEGCKLATSLMAMRPKEMWKMVADVWVEMTGYAAIECGGYDHAQQLEKGGELLSHVWLLMEHLGISKHFNINRDTRVKLAFA